jgi:2-polyprenyl-3-methyl-5-hydroxy-6-metoxy-1,4-benzoquinol methylase
VNEDILIKTGFSHYKTEDFELKNVVLRGGENAALWVHVDSGHGILDPKHWENGDYYQERYRSEFSAQKTGEKVLPEKHFDVYRRLNASQFAQFSDQLTHNTRYLEIGCSFGGVLKQVADFGVEVCHGIEPNSKDAEFIQKMCPQAKIFNSTFESLDLESEYYEMVACFEVLEHIVSPGSTLKKAAKAIKKNGFINIEVPNHRDVLLSCYKNSQYENFFYHKAHIHYFTEESLSQLFDLCGFDGAVTSFLMYPFFNHVFWHQNRGPQPSAQIALSTSCPTAGYSSADKAIDKFFLQVETDYRKLINRHMVGDCLVFRGRKR